jgi:Alpha-kinase family
VVEKRGRDCRGDYIMIMEAQAIAAYMAAEFNKIRPLSAKKIAFVEVSVVQTCTNDGEPIYYNVEKLLPDHEKFTKWFNNAGMYTNSERISFSVKRGFDYLCWLVGFDN